MSLRAPDARSRRLARPLAPGCPWRAALGLSWSSLRVTSPRSPTPPRGAQPSARQVLRSTSMQLTRTSVTGRKDSCCLVLQHLHWRRGTQELHVGTRASAVQQRRAYFKGVDGFHWKRTAAQRGA